MAKKDHDGSTPDRVCTGCGKGLDAWDGVGSFKEIPGGMFGPCCYDKMKKQIKDKREREGGSDECLAT
jgi:hypothetical protein